MTTFVFQDANDRSELDRKNNEYKRINDEKQRKIDESNRIAKENERIKNENQRKIDENSRIEAEKDRRKGYSDFITANSDSNLEGTIEAEVIGARGQATNLKERFDGISSQLSENMNNTNIELNKKADKNNVYSKDETNNKVWTMSNMGQDVKEAMTGGSVAVVERNSVLTENIVDGQVTNEKTSFMKNINRLNVDLCLIDKVPKWIGYNNDLTDDTNVTDSPNYVTSHVFECDEGETWIYEGGHSGSNIYYADSTKVLKQAIEVNNKTAFTIPPKMKYFRVVFTYNSDDYNNDKWKEKFKVVKGSTTEDIAPHGKNMMKNFTLDDGSVKERHLSQELKDKINGINAENDTLLIPRGANYSAGEAIVLLNFDGWNQNTFDIIAPYIKDKGLSYTLFFTGYDKGTGINPNNLRNYAKEMGKKFEMAMYTGQPSTTMEGTANFKEQIAQIKESYDGIVNYGLPKPKVCSYAGGVKTEVTEYLCQNVFGQKIGRTTENSKIVNPVTTAFSIPCSGYGDDGTYTISVVDTIVANKQHRALMTHNILNGDDITDTSYNMRESYLKAWIDKIALEVSKGSLKCMTFYEYYLYTILPHSSSVGQHALVWENDNRQHEYVYTENGWIELTNFQSYK